MKIYEKEIKAFIRFEPAYDFLLVATLPNKL